MRLRTSDIHRAGLRRVRCGRGFRYQDPTGAALADPDQLSRIRALAIPPAWRDVWNCPWPSGHLQSVGTDDAGRRQYFYATVLTAVAVADRPALSRLGERGRFGLPATKGAVEAAVLELLSRVSLRP
ncbi:hypothetical protein ABT009_03795 [Streptomyces sp. NPDC002896]|uniref:hypothetical protein n=1 Tax=Streptomyces sp. NPDC002896 TaxID=3154438 RepID=UPI00332E83AE